MKIDFILDSEIEEANDFHNAYYREDRTLSQWLWLFRGTISGVRPFIVARSQGRIVGTQALIPVIMFQSGKAFLTGKSEETLIHSSARGSGLFRRLYEPLLTLARNSKVEAIWGFTPASKAFEALGFTSPGSTSQLIFPLSTAAGAAITANMASSAIKPLVKIGVAGTILYSQLRYNFSRGADRSLRIQRLAEPPGESTMVMQSFFSQWGGTTIARDTEYLQWRFFDNPFLPSMFYGVYYNQHLIGWVVLAIDRNSVGYIVDIIFHDNFKPGKIAVALLSLVIEQLALFGASAVRTWFINSHPFDLLIRRAALHLGFLPLWAGESIVTLGLGISGDKEFDFRSWYINRTFTQGTLG